jgi:preprotein translocase subunit SecG
MEALKDVIIVIHLMVVVALIGVVLIQRSEGGALGIGGSNNFLTGRGSGNVLTRTTGILAAAFFTTSILLGLITQMQPAPSSILDTAPTTTAPAVPSTDGSTTTTAPAAGTSGSGGILDELNSFTGGSGAGQSGTATTPAEPATPAAPAEPQIPTTE